MLVQYSRKVVIFTFLFLPSFSVARICKPAPLSIYHFSAIFSNTANILSLLSKIQPYIIGHAATGFLFTFWRLCIPSLCPLGELILSIYTFAQNDVRTVFCSHQTWQKQGVWSSSPLLLVMQSTYFHSGNPSKLFSTLLVSHTISKWSVLCFIVHLQEVF